MKTSHSIWEIEEGAAICALDRGILFEISEDTDDGWYPTVASWVKAVTRLDENGADSWINSLTRKKNKGKIDYCGVTIVRSAEWCTAAIIEFNEPVTVVMGKVGDTLVTAQVSRIQGEFEHDFYFRRKGRQNKVANGFEIWFKPTSYLS